jgi:hypothetical protein
VESPVNAVQPFRYLGSQKSPGPYEFVVPTVWFSCKTCQLHHRLYVLWIRVDCIPELPRRPLQSILLLKDRTQFTPRHGIGRIDSQGFSEATLSRCPFAFWYKRFSMLIRFTSFSGALRVVIETEDPS